MVKGEKNQDSSFEYKRKKILMMAEGIFSTNPVSLPGTLLNYRSMKRDLSTKTILLAI
jgi:hypothetical protein